MIGVNQPRAASYARLLLGLVLGLTVALWGAAGSAAPKAPAKAKAETADQKVARSLLERAQDELGKGQPDAALSSFSAAKQLDDSIATETGIVDANLALGRPVAARATYAAFVDQNRSTLSPDQLAVAQAKLDELSAATAQLKLDVNEADVEIQVDGTVVGHSPLAEPLLLDPGNHSVSLQKVGFVALTQGFVLVRGPNPLSMTLVPEVQTGRLHVTAASTSGVTELLIDHQVVGLLPWEGSLPVGKVTLIARTNDSTSTPVDVMVEQGITTPVSLETVLNAGMVEVTSAVPQVEISVDGRRVGTQNWHGSLPVGPHHLAFARDGYLPQEQEVAVEIGATTNIAVAHWVPVKRAVVVPKLKDDRGLYFRLDLAGAFSSKSDGVTQHCREADTNARCAATAPFGASLGLRVGYRFKWLAPEIFGLGSFAVSYVRAQYDTTTLPTPDGDPFYGPARREDYIFFRYGWAAGAGVRFTTPTTGIAGTGGLGFGLFSESGQYARSTTSTSKIGVAGVGSVDKPALQSTTSSVEHSYAPGLLLDAGVLLGSSPGTQWSLGILAALEFAPEHSRTAPASSKYSTDPNTMAPYDYGTPGLDVVSGTQFRIGPVLGFQFGY